MLSRVEHHIIHQLLMMRGGLIIFACYAATCSGLHRAATCSGLHRAATCSGLHRAAPRRGCATRRCASDGDIVPFGSAGRVLDVLRDGASAAGREACVERSGCFVFEPAGAPWGCVHFVGGAGLGTYPQVAYGELLRRVAARTGVAVVATPYALSLDHDAAADACRRALEACLDDSGWAALPTLGLGHSLGAKLLLLLEAERQSYDRLVLVSANNFGLADSAKLLEVFLEGIDGPSSSKAPTPEGPWGSLADVVAAGAALAGVEIAPSPSATLDRLASVAADVAFIRFDRDDLDNSRSIGGALPTAAATDELEGDHLSPVFVRVGDDFAVGDARTIDAVTDAVSDALTAIPERKVLAAPPPPAPPGDP